VTLHPGPVEVSPKELALCCASSRWIEEIIAGRPYATMDTLVGASDTALRGLEWNDVLQALAAHPRIGASPAGADREAVWSRQEQSAAAGDAIAADRLAEGNLAYEARFGFGFLICATGRSAAEVLAALEQRLEHDAVTEQEVVRAELAAIVRLRLAKAFA